MTRRSLRSAALVAIVPLAAISLPAAAAEKSFMVTEFTALSSSGQHKVVVTTGKAPSVRAVGNQDAIDRLKVEVRGDTLKIGRKKDSSWSWSKSGKLTIHVTTHELKGAKLAGSGNINVDRMRGDDVALGLSGSGDLNVGKIDAGNLRIGIAGSGDMQIAGTCREGAISIAGSGDVNANALSCKRLNAKISGSGDIVADVSEAANLRIAGSGDIEIKGNPRCTVKTAGSGRVNCGG